MWEYCAVHSVYGTHSMPKVRCKNITTLSKHWNVLSYHHVREAVAGGWLRFEHILGTENPSNILTKPLPWFSLKIFVKPLLQWKGKTFDAPLGTSNPEESDAGPGLRTPQEPSSHGRDSTRVGGHTIPVIQLLQSVCSTCRNILYTVPLACCECRNWSALRNIPT